jgi:hypothetical protein
VLLESLAVALRPLQRRDTETDFPQFTSPFVKRTRKVHDARMLSELPAYCARRIGPMADETRTLSNRLGKILTAHDAEVAPYSSAAPGRAAVIWFKERRSPWPAVASAEAASPPS